VDSSPSGRAGVILRTLPPTGDSSRPSEEFEVNLVTRANANGALSSFQNLLMKSLMKVAFSNNTLFCRSDMR